MRLYFKELLDIEINPQSDSTLVVLFKHALGSFLDILKSEEFKHKSIQNYVSTDIFDFFQKQMNTRYDEMGVELIIYNNEYKEANKRKKYELKKMKNMKKMKKKK